MLFDRGGVCGRRDSHHGRGADTPAVVGRSFNPGDASSVPASDGDKALRHGAMVRLPDPVPSGDGEPMVFG
jgi:hypothetical protein